MKKKNEMEKNEMDFLRTQREFVIYFLKLLLKNPQRQDGKIQIHYYESESSESPYCVLHTDTDDTKLFICLKYQNEFFIHVWDQDDSVCDFQYSFREPDLINMIPLKIRKAMIKLYEMHFREVGYEMLV